MKRSWIGFILLLVLLLVSVMATVFMIRMQEPIEAELLQAAQLALEGNWERAGDSFRRAEKNWKDTAHFRSCLADHTPVEEIDGDFEMLKVFCASRETVSFAGGCLGLARQVAAVGEAHALVWWNLL